MGQSNLKEFERITSIAHGKIPVSEESSVFSFFAERRKIAQNILKSNHPKETDDYLRQYLEKLEDNIKEYLCL